MYQIIINKYLTARSFFIGAIFTVAFAVAKLRLGYTFWLSVGPTFWAEKSIVQTGDYCAIGLITLVSTVPETIAMKLTWNTHFIGTSELIGMARRKV